MYVVKYNFTYHNRWKLLTSENLVMHRLKSVVNSLCNGTVGCTLNSAGPYTVSDKASCVSV